MTAAKWWLAILVPLAIAASGFVSLADGRASGAIRVVTPLIVGLGAMPIAFAVSGGRGTTLGIAIVVATCAGSILASLASRTNVDYPTLVGWIGIAFGALFGLVAPLLALGWRSTAAAVWLGLSAVSCGSLALVRSGSSAIPEPLLVYNPIIRIMRHALDPTYDWLHAANMYPKVGTLYYAYPERTEGILFSAIAAGAGLVIAGMIRLLRRPSAEPAR